MGGSVFLLEDKENYQTNYQYDTMGWTYLVAVQNGENAAAGKAANIFTAKQDELLEAAAFYTTDAGTSYTVSVYTDVKGENPESGTLVSRQSGSEKYSGYHTIELEDPAAVYAGAQFSIVVEFTNPEHPAPIAVELYPCADPELDLADEMGTGHESYVYNHESGEWEDVYGALNGFQVTNVCIKGFANPLPDSKAELSTVRFSQLEGEVENGTPLILSSAGKEAIEYSLDGAPYTSYSSPITLSFKNASESHTIKARTVGEDGKTDRTVTKTYSQAIARQGDVHLFDGKCLQHVEFTDGQVAVELPAWSEDFLIQTVSPDSMSLNGQAIDRYEWSEPISISQDEEMTVQLEASTAGKISTLLSLTIRRSMLNFDYAMETVTFDKKYKVHTTDGTEIASGDSVTPLISDDQNIPLSVSYTDDQDETHTETWSIPARWSYDFPVYCLAEMVGVSFSADMRHGNKPDLSDAVYFENGDSLDLEPGTDVYLQRDATDMDFKSEIMKIESPARKEAPKLTCTMTTSSSLRFDPVRYGLYAIAPYDENASEEPDTSELSWQYAPYFTDLEPDTDYCVYTMLCATTSDFSSEIGVQTFRTAKAADLLDIAYRKAAAFDSEAFYDDYAIHGDDGFFSLVLQARKILLNRKDYTSEEANEKALELNQGLLELRLVPSPERLKTPDEGEQ